MVNTKKVNERQQSSFTNHPTMSTLEHHEPWFWLPNSDANYGGPDFTGRSVGLKDELPWKIKASILYSARAHPGVLRSLAVCHDECTVFTGGVGPGFKGSVQKWDLARMNCLSGYYGHDEVSYFYPFSLFFWVSVGAAVYISSIFEYIFVISYSIVNYTLSYSY